MAQPPPHERGAALLGVLLLVAIMAVLAGLMLDRLGLATRLAGNAQAQAAARRALAEGEVRLLARLAQPGGAQHRAERGSWAVPRGQIAWRLAPGGNCFNVNALVDAAPDGTLRVRPAGLLELRALMDSLGIGSSQAAPLAAAMADWIDSDALSLPDGTEDADYARLATPYRTAGRPLVAVGELRAVRGMSGAVYARLAPWLCALPELGSSPIALGSLAPGQGRLLAMFAPDALSVARAEQIIAQGKREHGLRFIVQHNGLGPKPQDRGQPGLAKCPNEGLHPARRPFGPSGSGCPNPWVLRAGADGQITAFQTNNQKKVRNPADLDSTLRNAWDNSDGIFVEIYEERLWEVQQLGPTGATLAAWTERFHERRRAMQHRPDPFPLSHSHTFKHTAKQGAQQLFYVHGTKCHQARGKRYGQITVSPKP